MAEASERIQGSMFEALFQRRLKPTGDFLEALRRAGYDLAHPEPEYDEAVFQRCLEIAREHAFSDVSRREGLTRLGSELVDGYFEETIAGKVVAAALPLVGPERMVKTLPRRMRTGISDLGEVRTEELGERRWKVAFPDKNPMPEFVAGALQRTMERTCSNPRVTVQYDVRSHTELIVEWDLKP